MERLRKSVIVLGAVFLACGVLFQLRAKPVIMHDGKAPDEKWLEGIAPKSVGKYQMLILDNGPETTYRMNEPTYQTLNPYGIVARVMETPREKYDTVVIMSNSKDSFHDPNGCFTSQGWVLERLHVKSIDTKAHGTIGVTIADLTREGQKTIAAFFYKGPDGFTPSNVALKWQMLLYQLKNFKDAEGVFYRFIPLHPDATHEQLARFIDEYLSESNKTSKGLL